MNTFLKRNKEIKIFTIVWLIAMTGLATFFLLLPPQEDEDADKTVILLLMPDEGYEFEVWGGTDINGSISHAESYNCAHENVAKNIYSHELYDMSCMVIIVVEPIESSSYQIYTPQLDFSADTAYTGITL